MQRQPTASRGPGAGAAAGTMSVLVVSHSKSTAFTMIIGCWPRGGGGALKLQCNHNSAIINRNTEEAPISNRLPSVLVSVACTGKLSMDALRYLI